jgi:predicted nucleic acid-binding protein
LWLNSHGQAQGCIDWRSCERTLQVGRRIPISFIALPPQAGQHYGAIRAALESKGEMMGNNDLWIAAHAKAAAFTLVSNNEHEFRRIPGLKVQNWVE